jgi:hypothetical protein
MTSLPLEIALSLMAAVTCKFIVRSPRGSVPCTGTTNDMWTRPERPRTPYIIYAGNITRNLVVIARVA